MTCALFIIYPLQKKQKKHQEAQVKKVVRSEIEVDLVVMARYMQILSSQNLSTHFTLIESSIFTIHFYLLFKGQILTRRAYERGVKLIGATAHYATEDLDEGPIIEQDVKPVTHESTTKTLKRIGADIEKLVLARAVKCHLNNQIIVSGNRAIVFPEAGE